jgi:carbohydrate-selective porin OprB
MIRDGMADPSCAPACGLDGPRYVFVVSGKVYEIENQDFVQLLEDEGQTVRLTGQIQGDSITVSKIVMAVKKAPSPIGTAQEETLSGPDAHVKPEASNGHLFGDWGGVRTRLLDRGVKVDIHSTWDTLWNIESPQRERVSSNDRVRGTVDIDLAKFVHWQGWSFHMTGLWQGGDNLASYLKLDVAPSSLASQNALRLDSWWFEKRLLNKRLALRMGQFAAEDTYGNPNFGPSFVFEAMGGPIDNLFNTYESFDPFSTPAFEIRVVPFHNFFVKSMVESVDRTPFTNNETGLVPRFHGPPVSVSEIGFTPGHKGAAPADNETTRKGYEGLYQFGASYNPGKFVVPGSVAPRPGNYLIYAKASQAVWRADREEARGLDATFATDWSPPSIDHNNRMLFAGLRYNQPLPLKIYNTLSLGYVQNSFSPQFLPALKTERGVEFNAQLQILPMVFVTPVFQYYADAGGSTARAVVFGFRTRIEF